MTGPLTLRIGGDPRQLSTARAFAGSVGSVLGMDEGQRHDLRLAVSELATAAINAGLMELSLIVHVESETPELRLMADGNDVSSVPLQTAELLAAMFNNSVWSSARPGVIRLVVDGPS